MIHFHTEVTSLSEQGSKVSHTFVNADRPSNQKPTPVEILHWTLCVTLHIISVCPVTAIS